MGSRYLSKTALFWPKNGLSPRCHRFVTAFFWGRKVRKRLGKAPTSLQAKVGLEPGAGLVWAWFGPGAGLVRAWCGPGAGLVRAWCGPGAGLVRAWCGPGAGLAILCRAQDCCLNPAAATELLRPFLRHTQDCPDAAPAALAWRRSCPSTAL